MRLCLSLLTLLLKDNPHLSFWQHSDSDAGEYIEPEKDGGEGSSDFAR